VAIETGLGPAFARAFTGKDAARMRQLLHPDVSFRGLTPNFNWEAADVDGALEIMFENWLEDTDHVDSLDQVETGTVGDRQRVGYRFTVTNAEGTRVAEQQAYFGERDGRIDWVRIVCSGMRPLS
jgi:hypothetical protein